MNQMDRLVAAKHAIRSVSEHYANSRVQAEVSFTEAPLHFIGAPMGSGHQVTNSLIV